MTPGQIVKIMDDDRDVPKWVWRTNKEVVEDITNGIINGILWAIYQATTLIIT